MLLSLLTSLGKLVRSLINLTARNSILISRLKMIHFLNFLNLPLLDLVMPLLLARMENALVLYIFSMYGNTYHSCSSTVAKQIIIIIHVSNFYIKFLNFYSFFFFFFKTTVKATEVSL